MVHVVDSARVDIEIQKRGPIAALIRIGIRHMRWANTHLPPRQHPTRTGTLDTNPRLARQNADDFVASLARRVTRCGEPSVRNYHPAKRAVVGQTHFHHKVCFL